MDVNTINVLVLAYLGDTIYEDYIRLYLINKGINNVNELQSSATSYVSAKAQASFVYKLTDLGFFTEEELSVLKRARNYKSSNHPKNTDIMTYKYATGFEAVIGYLKLKNNNERIDEIINKILSF